MASLNNSCELWGTGAVSLSLVVWNLALRMIRAEEYYFLQYKSQIVEVFGRCMGSGLVGLYMKGALGGVLFANSRN